MSKPWWTQNKELYEEIINLRREIAALRWSHHHNIMIYGGHVSAYPEKQREEYKQETEAFEAKTKELEDES